MKTPTPLLPSVQCLFASVALVLFLAAASACRDIHDRNPDDGSPVPREQAAKHTNKLAGSSSPYLLEHAHNPVNWYPWGSEALEKARAENKPIFLSVGYSACHWCHVMGREDFENDEIAGILNANFIAIKVDREQRPDIDAQYMLAVQMMTGSGGWPMSVFLTPDRKPFYGGTYFPPAEFKSLLNKVVEVYAKQPEAVRAQADKVSAAIVEASKPAASGKLAKDVLTAATQAMRRRFDSENGGFSKRPKFPEAPNLAFLLARYRKTGDKNILSMVTTTLDHMADGGIYDHLGGGFHRYSTDAIWRVPHFEKMLYDQSQLVSIYLEAHRITHKPRYRQVAEETLAFVSREMRDKEGGFYSTLDADSEGVEGKYYLWTPSEVQSVLGGDAPEFNSAFGVTVTGDLDGKSVLHLSAGTDAMLNLSVLRQKLFTARQARVRPHTDDKVLASWNGLMIAAYAQAYEILGEQRYRAAAEEAAGFLTKSMMSDGKLRHSYRAGQAEVPGLLEDYACCAYGLLALAEATHDRSWQERAQALAVKMREQFGDAQNGGFYASASQGELLTRMKDGEDNAMPSANGIAAQVLARLARLTGEPRWRQQALRTVQAFQAMETRAPSAFPSLLTAYQNLGPNAALAAPQATVELKGGPISGRAGEEVTIPIHAKIRPGWHINAHAAKGASLIPTTLKLAQTTGVSLVRITYPDGKSARFAFSRDRLSIYEGDCRLTATVRLARSAKPGRQLLRFMLHYQACNDRSCLAPADCELRISADIR